jgi:L-threonylcarbamoyladenylate synthase
MTNNPVAEANTVNYNFACRILAQGNLVSFPTETVYGLGADATNGDAVAKIFTLKQRPSFNPLIIHLSNMRQVAEYTHLDKISEELGGIFWPGPFTLILPLKEKSGISPMVTAGQNTIAVRIPRNDIAHELLSQFGGPIAAPSANLSGQVSPTTAQHVAREFGPNYGDLQMILDGGPCTEGIESTIIQVTDKDIKILRPGSITIEDIEKATSHPIHINTVQQHETHLTAPSLISPGLMKSHYAPKTKIRLDAVDVRENEAMLGFGKNCPLDTPFIRNLSKDGDLYEAAANLFSMIRELDELNLDSIAVSPIPMHGIGAAINDRLNRAAAPKENIQLKSAHALKKQALDN